MGPPWWRDLASEFRLLSPEELPEGVRTGYEFVAPTVDMPVYLNFLQERFLLAGGKIEQRELRSFSAAFAASKVVVNCTGLGARELCLDSEVFPIRGQIVRVRSARDRFLLDTDHPDGLVYIVPRNGECYLGGVATKGSDSLAVDFEEADSILARCRKMMPELREGEVLGHAVGIRPGRASVRGEAERLPAGLLVHCYGHGGIGVTLSWGAAREVCSHTFSAK
jgi:D-amino-acid oxidase